MSLWSNTPQVKESAVLEHMNPGEIKLQEAMFEVSGLPFNGLYNIFIINIQNFFLWTDLTLNNPYYPLLDQN